jgi:hypothetical protein
MNKQTRVQLILLFKKKKKPPNTCGATVTNSSVQKHEGFYISVPNSADLTIPKSQLKKPNSPKIQNFSMTMAAMKSYHR